MKNRNLINVPDATLEKIKMLNLEFKEANLNEEIAIVEAESRLESYCNYNDIELDVNSEKYKLALAELIEDYIERDVWEMMDDSDLDEYAEETALKHGICKEDETGSGLVSRRYVEINIINTNLKNVEKAIGCNWEPLCFDSEDEDFFMSVRRGNKMFGIIVDGEKEVLKDGIKLTSDEIYDLVSKNINLYVSPDITIEYVNWFSVVEYSIIDGENGEEIRAREGRFLKANITSISELEEYLISCLESQNK